ncbi:MAG TPA: serine/threonine-protein kinase [Kofleriaceae bacterium]
MEADPLLDTVVSGRYHVIRKLGEGGMSVVYEVQHAKLKRQFALKRLLPMLSGNEEALVRFEREAELLASLHHPNVVEITDWDYLEDGAPFMILEFLHGAHIRVRIDRGPLPWDAIAKIGEQTMSALQLAHRIGITHRDLKPENLFISIDDSGEERVKLLDFGVSKMRGLGRTTGVHAMLGTPSYMSPEQAQGQTELIGPSTDVWAMGTILYEMATQRVAFTGESLAATVVNITSGRPAPITTLRPDASPAFVDLVDRAISLDPERRIVTIEELRAGLRSALEPRARASSPVQSVTANRPVTGSQPIETPPYTTKTPTFNTKTPTNSGVTFQTKTPSSPSLTPPVTVLAPARNVNYWIIGTTAVVAILAVFLVLFLN